MKIQDVFEYVAEQCSHSFNRDDKMPISSKTAENMYTVYLNALCELNKYSLLIEEEIMFQKLAKASWQANHHSKKYFQIEQSEHLDDALFRCSKKLLQLEDIQAEIKWYCSLFRDAMNFFGYRRSS